jgi:hypothetical protein
MGRIEIHARLTRALSVIRKAPEKRARGSSQRKSG